MTFLDYAPAPESQAILNLRSEYGLFIGGEFRAGGGTPFSSINPATEKHITTIAHANEADVDAAVAAARKAYDKTWSRLSGSDRGKYLFRIARLVQERSRELAVAESLDNGKPIKESRDVDVPLVAAWFFYYAGWADKLDHVGLGASPAPAGRRRAGHPVELPAAHARVEDRPGAGRGQHRGAQAGGDHVADGAAVRGDRAAGRPAARRRQHHHRRGRPRVPAGRAPRRRQGRVHRVDVGRARDRQAGRPGRARSSRSSWAARPRTSCSTTRRSTRPSRASSTASSSTRATSAAPAAACWSRSPCTTRWSTGSRPACRRCAWATRSTRTPTSARSTARSSWSGSGR